MLNRVPHRILLLEPAETIRRSLSAYLATHGFDVESVATEQETIDRLARSFGVVIIDIGLEGRRGFRVVEHVLEHLPELLPRVVVITADDTEQVRQHLHRIGVCDIVPKPLRADDILAAVRQCLQSAEATLH